MESHSTMPHTRLMVDTSAVRRLLFLPLLLLVSLTPASARSTWASAVLAASHSAPQARIVLLDATTGHLLASAHLAEAARTLAAPGSTLKPLALFQLIRAGRWQPARRVACSRQLHVSGHALNCSHPPASPMDAVEALTWSCNSYFAEVADALRPAELRSLLTPTGLLGPTGLYPIEASATFQDPLSADATRLALLGVEGIRVTPLELARAYAWLAAQLAADPQSSASQAVLKGLTDSASFGMAAAASPGGVSIAGKTGTAEGNATSRTHGWSVALVPAAQPRFVLVLYLPSGRGRDAAALAAEILAQSPLAGRP